MVPYKNITPSRQGSHVLISVFRKESATQTWRQVHSSNLKNT